MTSGGTWHRTGLEYRVQDSTRHRDQGYDLTGLENRIPESKGAVTETRATTHRDAHRPQTGQFRAKNCIRYIYIRSASLFEFIVMLRGKS